MIRFGTPMRRRFLLEPGTAFLNHGSFGTAPRVVLAGVDRWRRRMEANPDRFLREEMPAALRAAANGRPPPAPRAAPCRRSRG